MMVVGTALVFLALFSLVSIVAGSEDPRRDADPRERFWIKYGLR